MSLRSEPENIDQTDLRAGSFSRWLCHIRKALAENSRMKVPCGECNACCRSSIFIHVHPEETRTFSRVPKELLFPAPLRPKGHMVLGYDKHGRCPMLIRNKCSIYRDRPATCRSFDCRILSASGLIEEDNVNHPVFQQARRWKFKCTMKDDDKLLSAVQDAAKCIMNHPKYTQDIIFLRDAIQISVLAIKVYDVFFKSKRSPVHMRKAAIDSEIAAAIVNSLKKFERRK
jgi:uncharacterized protein